MKSGQAGPQTGERSAFGLPDERTLTIWGTPRPQTPLLQESDESDEQGKEAAI